MTTIAYRDGMVAADGVATRGDMVVEKNAQKIVRLTDGRIAAIAGDINKLDPFVAWLEKQEGEQPSLAISEGGTTTVIVFGQGRITEYQQSGRSEICEEYCAWGSGTGPAMAAFAMGADAKKAVEVACQVDVWSGGNIIEMRVEE